MILALQHRQRRALAARLLGVTRRCWYCAQALPSWDGRFRRNPHADHREIDWINRPPDASFRIPCDACRRDNWFDCWLDGTTGNGDYDTTTGDGGERIL